MTSRVARLCSTRKCIGRPTLDKMVVGAQEGLGRARDVVEAAGVMRLRKGVVVVRPGHGRVAENRR